MARMKPSVSFAFQELLFSSQVSSTALVNHLPSAVQQLPCGILSSPQEDLSQTRAVFSKAPLTLSQSPIYMLLLERQRLPQQLGGGFQAS